MKDRLQFRHHNQIFSTREDAINYILNDIRYSESGLSAEDKKQHFSLYAEPTVLRYKNDDDASNPHIILAIGSQDNQTDGAQYSDNRYCFIDIDKTEKEIEGLDDKIKDAISNLTMFVKNSNTLSLSIERDESGDTISGSVNVAENRIFNEKVVPNTLLATEDGLFTYVNMSYDKDVDKLTFTVNGETKEWDVNNNYITGGTYSIKDESLHLGRLKGDDIVVSFEDLINEWDVEGLDSSTPIVLTREKVGYEDDTVVDHRHGNKWQDTLKADVRILNDGMYNILQKTADGKALFVKGTADNIKFSKGNGVEMTVAEALIECANKKLSTDNDNLIYERPDGFFAEAKLEYDNTSNTLTFTKSNQSGGTSVSTIALNSVQFIDNARYDRDTETIIFSYFDGNKNYKELKVPVGSLIDEWDVQNDGHSISLSKTRNTDGSKDILSADVKISNDDDNILTVKGNELYVQGTSSKIKHGDNSTVKDEINAIKEKNDDFEKRITSNTDKVDSVRSDFDAAKISLDSEIERAKEADKANAEAIADAVASIGSGFTSDSHETVTCKFEHLTDDVNSKVKFVSSSDNSVTVDNTDPTSPKLKVNLSTENKEGIPNLIEAHKDGMFAAVDLQYNTSSNTLTFITTNNRKEIPLVMNSIVDRIYYDASREAIIIVYTVNGKQQPDVEVKVRDLIDEWDVSANTSGAIKLTKVKDISRNADILSADIIVSEHDDNMLINDSGSLYVSSAKIDGEIARAKEAESKLSEKVEGLENIVDDSIVTFVDTTSISVDSTDKKNTKVAVKISNSDNNLISIDTVKQGVYATAKVSYDQATNELKLSDKDGNVISYTKLGGGSIIESITYDKDGKNLVITYTDADGKKYTTSVPVEDLFNAWAVENPSSGSAIKLEKETVENGTDILRAYANVSADASNMLKLVGNALYVSDADVKKNAANIATVSASTSNLTVDVANNAASISAISASTKEISGKVETNAASINSNTSAIEKNANAIAANTESIKNEVTRAISAETDIKTSISQLSERVNSEIDRSTKADESHTSSINSLKEKDSSLESAISEEKVRATSAETAIKTSIIELAEKVDNEVARSTEADTSHAAKIQSLETSINTLDASLTTLDAKVDSEIKRASDADTEHNTKIKAAEEKIDTLRSDLTTETNRATKEEARISTLVATETTARENAVTSLTHSISDVRDLIGVLSSSTSASTSDAISKISDEKNRAEAAESKLKEAIDAEVTRSTNVDNEHKTAIDAEVARAKEAETAISTNIDKEVVRAANAENTISDSVATEIARAKKAEADLDTAIKANKLNFASTNSISLVRSEATDPNTVTANVKIANAKGNLITLNGDTEGLFATASLQYNGGNDTLTLLDSNGEPLSTVPLGAGSLVENIVYDSSAKTLSIEYKVASTGEIKKVSVSVEDLYNEWVVNNDNSVITLNKAHNTGSPDILTATVNIKNDTTNILVKDGNALYVSNSGITKNATDIAALSGSIDATNAEVENVSNANAKTQAELDKVERATLGISHTTDFDYVPSENSKYITSADSLYRADELLDSAIYELSAATTATTETVDKVKTELKSVEKLLTGAEAIDGATEIAYPKTGDTHTIIGTSVSYADADDKLENAIKDIQVTLNSSSTETANVYVEGEGVAKRLKADVILSNHGGLTDDDLEITSSEDIDYKDGQNAIRVDKVGSSHGLFLSNKWDCGDYEDGTDITNIFNTKFSNKARFQSNK